MGMKTLHSYQPFVEMIRHPSHSKGCFFFFKITAPALMADTGEAEAVTMTGGVVFFSFIPIHTAMHFIIPFINDLKV